MVSQLDTLFKLQTIDDDLLAKQRQIDAYESELGTRRSAIQACKTRIEGLASRRKALVTQRALAERQVSDQEESLKEKRQRLQRARTERELRAGEDEVSILRDEISNSEASALELMSQVEEFERQIAAIQTELNDLAEADRRHVAEDAERIAGLQTELDDERGARDAVAADLEVPLRKRYDLVLARRAGVAVVPVNNGCCAGCHMQVPPQLLLEIMRTGAIRVCQNCSRVLYAKAPETDPS